MQTKMLVKKPEQATSRTNTPANNNISKPAENKKNVRTADYKKLLQMMLNDPDALTREEFLFLQSIIGYRQAAAIREKARLRKKQRKLEQTDAVMKPFPLKKANSEFKKNLDGKIEDSETKNDEKKPLQMKKDEDNTSTSGSEVQHNLRAGLEKLSGVDLSDVKVHKNSDKPQQVGALAYTQGNDIHIAPGQDRHLAHEGWHAVQQKQGRVVPTLQMKSGISVNDNRGLEKEADINGEKAEEIGKRMYMAGAGKNTQTDNNSNSGTGSSVIQKKDDSKTKAGDGASTGFGELQLKGMSKFTPSKTLDDYLSKNQSGAKVNVRYGNFARGTVKVTKTGGRYTMIKQAIPVLRNPFSSQSSIIKIARPCLVVGIDNDMLIGYLGIWDGVKVPQMDYLKAQFINDPSMLGLRGINLDNSLQIVNSINKGQLRFGINNARVVVGRAFNGTVSIDLEPDSGKIGFSGSAGVNIKGLANGTLTLARSAQGNITALATLAVKLTPHFSGGLTIKLDGESVTGMGTVGYQGEKLSGMVLMKLADKNSTTKAGESKASSGKNSKAQYVLSGEGDLIFQFNDWLTGNAQAEIDEKGNVTIVGKITPQKELELFPQKDFQMDILKAEARAIYGVPVVGNVYVFANIGLSAFAKIGPAKLYKIEVGGTYSTDPAKCKDFSIQGSLNVSAAAGLTLRAEGGAGLEILQHNLKTGVGISATAGIAAYAEATPIIGYRENSKSGQDKKGDFFISGELEIAAQPFFALGGDVFVEVDSPWWSPLPDKKWQWPLINKTYPLGNTFGVTASVDHVLGSKQPPKLEFGKASFSEDKFLTDIMSNKTGGKKSQDKKPGKWKEKNSKNAQPPNKGKVDKGSTGKVPSMPSVKPSRKLPGQKKTASPNLKTSDGKTVKQHKDFAVRDYKPGSKYYKSKTGKQSDQLKERDTQVNKGLDELRALTAKYDANGVSKSKLQKEVNAVKKRYKVFKSINVVDGGGDWDFEYEYNPKRKQDGPSKQVSKKRKLNVDKKSNGVSKRSTLKQTPKAGKYTKKKNAARSKASTKKSLLPGEGKVGTYKELVKSGSRGDNITPHHMPSAEYMRENYGIAKNDGVCMNMEQPSPGAGGRHRSTRSYGNGSDLTEAPNDALNRDIEDARRVYQNDGLYTSEIQSSLQKVKDMNKRLFPKIFGKPRR